jgi:hypothetical protein
MRTGVKKYITQTAIIPNGATKTTLDKKTKITYAILNLEKLTVLFLNFDKILFLNFVKIKQFS